MSLNHEIDKNGWILAKNVFSSEEINKLRKFALKNENHKGD